MLAQNKQIQTNKKNPLKQTIFEHHNGSVWSMCLEDIVIMQVQRKFAHPHHFIAHTTKTHFKYCQVCGWVGLTSRYHLHTERDLWVMICTIGHYQNTFSVCVFEPLIWTCLWNDWWRNVYEALIFKEKKRGKELSSEQVEKNGTSWTSSL